MFNEVTLLGRLGQKPELKTASNGDVKLCSVSLATEDMRQPKEKRKTQWHRLTFFGRQAEVVCDYCDKGALLLVKGKVEYSEYEKSGVKITASNVIVSTFQILPTGEKKDSSQARAPEDGGFPF